MKFSSGFTAFVAASVATANLGAAAPVSNNGLATRDVSQSNSQSTSQQASGKNVEQNSDSAQHNNQGVKISKDASFHIKPPAVVVEHPSSGSGSTTPSNGGSGSTTPATSEGSHGSDEGKTGDLISLDLLNGNKANVQAAGIGNQSNKRSTGNLIDANALNGNDANVQALGTGNQKNVDSHKEEHHDKHRDAQTGDLISAILLNDNDANAQVAGTGNQKNKRGLFGSASGKQTGSADGFGGSSFQGQSNAPVLSGAGNSLTAGGLQQSQNDGQGGSIEQTLSQLQNLGGGLGKRQLFASGKQTGSADGFGGSSFQYQNNRPVVSGTSNSVTAGGAQGATNNGQGGSISQQLQQLLGRRQIQGLGQGINQGIDQTGSANAHGGAAYIYGNNGPAYVDGTATAGTVNQGAAGQQDGAQSATQGLTQQTLNRFFARQLQDLEQGIGQGIHQNGQADAQGGSAYLVGGNGPAYVKNGATAGAVNQNGQASQKGQQSGTQSLQQSFQNLFGRDIQDQDQGVSQGTTQTGSADADGGNVHIVGGWSAGPVTVDASSHAGVVDQNSSSNQKSNQGVSQNANKENVNQFWARQTQTQAQGNEQNVNTNADVSASASPKVASGYFFTHHPIAFDNNAVAGSVSQNVQADQANKQGASQNANNVKNIQARAVPAALSYGAQDANADAHGGSSYSAETNDKVVNGNGVTSVQGGPQTSNGSAAAGSIKQLLQL